MDKYARSFQQGVRRPILLLLLLMASFVFYATMLDTSRQGNYAAYAQSSDYTAAWPVRSFIWSRNLNAWARTDCTMTIGGLDVTVSGAARRSDCSNTGAVALSFLQYYHDIDPDDETSKKYGKIKGRAWSPLYGLIYFDPSDFPSSACYGLTGDARQPRIERPEGGDVRIVGCAYVPLLRDYILFNRSGATHAGIPTSGWSGVHVTTVENAANAYLVLRGCAWSSSNGFWSFGANQTSSPDGKQNCLASGHNTELKKALPESRIGTPGSVFVSVKPIRSSLKIGQQARYQYTCPPGYNTPQLTIGSRIFSVANAALKLFRGYHSEIFTDPVSTLLLTCSDGTGVFTSPRSSSGAVTSSVQNSFFISSFTVTPSVLTEGGFVSFGGSVSNQGGFANRVPVDAATGHCDNTEKYGCTYGTPNETVFDDSNSSYYQWRCDGIGDAAHSGICQIPKESSPSTGLCDNTVRNGCTIGTANDTAVADITAYYRWRCDGVNGGKDSGTCQFSTGVIPGNEGYCTITNKVTGQELQRFDVESVNVAISGSDLAVRDAVYDLQCRYKRFNPDKSFQRWQPVSAPLVAVKVLPRNVSERDISDTVDSPVFSDSTDTVSVTIPSGAAMVYVYRLGDSSSRQITADSLYKVFIDRDAVELSNTETLQELRERLFEPTVRTKVVPVSSRSGGITKSAVAGKSLVAVARTTGGVWSQQAVYTLSGDGACDETVLNRCSGGIFNDIRDSDTHYLWRCEGVGGGRSPTCSIDKSSITIGVCDNTFLNKCSVGTFIDAGDSRTHYQWKCQGTDGRNPSDCSILRSTVIAGDCDNTFLNKCSVGTSKDIGNSRTHYQWQCLGAAGGEDDDCSILRSSVKVGVCDESVRNKCSVGTSSALDNSATHHQWRCSGVAGGGPSPTCQKRIPIPGGWTDWTPLASAQQCGNSFTQTRSCTNPAPAYGGANCSGSSSRAGGVGTQCPAGQVCKNGSCIEHIDCPRRSIYIGAAWSVGGTYCFAASYHANLPDGLAGESFTVHSKPPSNPVYGRGSITYQCGDSGWAESSRTCSR